MSVAKWMGLGMACVVVTACASLKSVESFTPGTVSIEQVRAKEKPAAEWKNVDGTLTLEYDARPDTEQNVMLDFDAKGKLAAVREVITLENMALIRPAMTKMELKRILGNPRHVSKDGVTGGEIWEWPLEPADSSLPQKQITVLLHPTADGVMRVTLSVRYP